jgi:hypothetical protein
MAETPAVKIENFSGKEIIIRQGSALPLKEPNIIRIEGDLRSVGAFIKGRSGASSGHSTQELDETKVIVYTDYKAMTIELLTDPESAYGATVKGRLEESDELKRFYINKEKMWKKDEFVKLLKFSKMYFSSPEAHEKVLAAYTYFTADTSGHINDTKDTRGNKDVAFKKSVTTNIPLNFMLHIPIFKGEKHKKFSVDICLDVSESSALFWLESVELAEMIEKEKNVLFEDAMKDATRFVVINK